MIDEIQPVPEDDPRLADDPLYAAMSPAKREQHRWMLAQMDLVRAEYAARPHEPTFEEQVLDLLRSIDAKLAQLLERERNS
jgi:hypothetical protein